MDENIEQYEDNQIRRKMPRSDESELSVIGSMLLNRDAVTLASEILTKDDFYNKQYGIMFDTIVQMNNEGEEIDEVTFLNRLQGTDLPSNVTTLENIANIMNATPTSVKVRTYANIVKSKALLRKMIEFAQNLENDCYADKKDVDVILESTEKEVFNLIKNKGADDFEPISSIVFKTLQNIEAAGKSKGPVTGVATGFVDLDYRTAGLQPSDLILIAARPSMGKTAFVLNIAQYAAIRNNVPTAIFSLEMSKTQLMNRLFSLETGIDAQKLRTGDLSEEDWMILAEASSNVGSSKLVIDDTPSITISNLKSKCRKYKLDYDIGLVIIDYLQLMETGGRVESHQLAIAEVSKSLKALARELQVPVVALSQLSRSVEKREDKRPILSDLRDSGAIEQDADVVMFIHREFYHNKGEIEKANVAEIIVAKQRNGPIGTVELAWIPELTKFANKERDRQ